MDNVMQQKIMETIINIRRKNRRPDTDMIYKELTKDCASNINADDLGNQIKLMIDNGLLENRPSNQGLDSLFILNSNIPTSPSRNNIESEQLGLCFSPSLATRSQVNFSVETPEICKHTDEIPEIFDYKDLNAKFVAMKNEIYELKLEIKSLKGGVEKINSKSSPEKNYDHELNIKNSFLEQQNSFLKQEIISKQNIIDKTDLILKEKGDNMINVNNDSINGIAQGFSSSNEIMSYSGSNTRIGITKEGNSQSITKKLQNNIETKDNMNKNHTVDNNKVKEKK